MIKWYVLQTKPGAEEAAAKSLEETGYKILLPRARVPVRSGGSWKVKENILMPGYLMVETEYTAENYYRIRGTEGILKFAGNGRESYLSTAEAEYMKLLGREVLEPSEVEKADGGYKIRSGILARFPKEKIKLITRDRKAVLTISMCGEDKKVTLGLNVPEDPKETKAD